MEAEKKNAGTRVRRLLTTTLAHPDSVTTMSSEDLDFTLRISRRVRLHGRLAAKLKKEGLLDDLPDTARAQLQSALVMAESRSRLARWELNRIAWALASEEDVALVVMKGCTYLLLALPNSAGRIFADVDLLLNESDLEPIEAVAKSVWVVHG